MNDILDKRKYVKGKIKIICLYCKKEKMVYYSHRNKKFCNRKCFGLWRSQNLLGENNPNYMPMKKVFCELCGESFHVKLSSDRRFCGKACAARNNVKKANIATKGKPAWNRDIPWSKETKKKISIGVLKGHTKEGLLRLSIANRKRAKDPKDRKLRSDMTRKYFKDNPEAGKRQSIAMKKRWQDPGFRKNQVEKMIIKSSDLDYRKKQSDSKIRLWQDPEYRKRMIDAMKKAWKDPELRKRISKAGKKRYKDPEYRKRMIVAQIKKRPDLYPIYPGMADEEIAMILGISMKEFKEISDSRFLSDAVNL